METGFDVITLGWMERLKNAKLEKAGRSKMQCWKTSRWKRRDRTASRIWETGKHGTKLQGLKTRVKACVNCQEAAEPTVDACGHTYNIHNH